MSGSGPGGHGPRPSEVAALHGRQVLVVGDAMLDEYLVAEAGRLAPEGPFPVLTVVSRHRHLGGAANVAANVQALGGHAHLVSVVGADPAGEELVSLAREAGLDGVQLIRDPGRPTTVKSRLSTSGLRILRLDTESREPIAGAARNRVTMAIRERLGRAHAVVLSDYGKGVLTAELVGEVIDTASRLGIPVVSDPKTGDLRRYRGSAVLVPSLSDTWTLAGGGQFDGGHLAGTAAAVRDATAAQIVVLKLGGGGLYLDVEGAERHWIPAFAGSVNEVAGAGDTVTAVCALGQAAGLGPHRSALLASAAAAVAVSRRGTTAVSAADLRGFLRAAAGRSGSRGRVTSLAALRRDVQRWRAAGLRVVVTNGCFDLLHAGHLATLRFARGQGDLLVVAVNTDAGVRRAKGVGRPVLPEAQRAGALAELDCVDRVVLFDEPDASAVVEAVAPDVYVKGGDYAGSRWPEAELATRLGGRVLVGPLVPGISTTRIIESAARAVGPSS